MCVCVYVCVCVCVWVLVLTGLWNRPVWPNYEVVGFQASVSDCSVPRLCCLLLFILPYPSCYSNARHIYHMSSSPYLGFPGLRPTISVCHTRSFSYLGVSRHCPIMPTTYHASTSVQWIVGLPNVDEDLKMACELSPQVVVPVWPPW